MEPEILTSRMVPVQGVGHIDYSIVSRCPDQASDPEKSQLTAVAHSQLGAKVRDARIVMLFPLRSILLCSRDILEEVYGYKLRYSLPEKREAWIKEQVMQGAEVARYLSDLADDLHLDKTWLYDECLRRSPVAKSFSGYRVNFDLLIDPGTGWSIGTEEQAWASVGQDGKFYNYNPADSEKDKLGISESIRFASFPAGLRTVLGHTHRRLQGVTLSQLQLTGNHLAVAMRLENRNPLNDNITGFLMEIAEILEVVARNTK